MLLLFDVSVTALGDLVQIVPCDIFLHNRPNGRDTSQLRTPNFAYMLFDGVLISGAGQYGRHLSTGRSRVLVAGEHEKLVDYARFRVPDRSKLVVFVLDINGALFPRVYLSYTGCR